ncbi:unnamed protein product [Ranitomeya imitator]|uniref:Uncharacterized protein n=1 Tax=Ranitomeya imitator TaxID=111125 RepID=A0ABN9LKM8_9NEOB|nr:unnamed protein product [Ranitomeya imitator]
MPFSKMTTLPNCAVECTRREIQTKPGTLKDEEESDGALNRNMESFGQTCFCLMSNVEKMEDKNSVKNKAVSHALSSEKKQMVTKLGAKESADKSNYNLELLSSDTEGCSENQVNVDTVLCTHQSQGSSMIVDDESDFIVLSPLPSASLCFPHSVTAGRKVKVEHSGCAFTFTLRPAVSECGKHREADGKGPDGHQNFYACNQGKHRVTKRGPALSYPMFTLVTQGPRDRWSQESCLCDSSPATTLRFTYDHGQVISLVVIVGKSYSVTVPL